jgi:NAD-dependent dihydropyrimidine dehydrogenase PreA subunit
MSVSKGAGYREEGRVVIEDKSGGTPADLKGEAPYVEIVPELCKGCSLCVVFCPPKVLSLSSQINTQGYHPAAYSGEGCTGCGLCFYACPEPGTIRVVKKG